MAISFSIHDTLSEEQFTQLKCVYANALLGKTEIIGFNPESDTTNKINEIKAASDKGHTRIILAYENSKLNKNKLVGFIFATQKDKTDIELNDICTITKKGYGLGTELLWKLFESAKEIGIEAISLEASHSSEFFYLKYGFILEKDGAKIQMYNDTITDTCERLRIDCKMKGYNKNMAKQYPYAIAA